MKFRSFHRCASLFRFLSFTIAFSALSHAAKPVASDGDAMHGFGTSVSISGDLGIVGAYFTKVGTIYPGSAYIFQGISTGEGVVVQESIIRPSTPKQTLNFGNSVSLSGSSGLVGAYADNINGDSSGSVSLYHGLDTAAGAVSITPGGGALLLPTDAAENQNFGRDVALSGGIGLISAPGDNTKGSYAGAAYVFRGLDTATGTAHEAAKLTASDGAGDASFGSSVSISGTTGIIGAQRDMEKGYLTGAAYLFRNLDTATGSITQNAKLTASDPSNSGAFGAATAVSGNLGVVGSSVGNGLNSKAGAAYLYRNLDTASGSITEDAKLVVSDGKNGDRLGGSVAISGSTALIGAVGEGNKGRFTGAAYFYQDLDNGGTSYTETLKIIASDGAGSASFGSSVAMDGDNFLIGATSADGIKEDSGAAYSGSISSMTTVDLGQASLTISNLSFESRTDWIIGENTSQNQVILNLGNTATVGEMGKTVFIGKNAGSDSNILDIAGTLATQTVSIGALSGTFQNSLVLRTSANIVNSVEFILGESSELILEGDFTAEGALLARLDSTILKVWDGGSLQTVTPENMESMLGMHNSDGFTIFKNISVPEPSVAMLGAMCMTLFFRRKR